MSDFQNAYEPSYEPYQRFQGGNFWMNAAASYASPSFGSQDWIGGSLNNPYRTLADQFSAFQRDQTFNKMFEAGAVNTAYQGAALPNSILGAFMRQGAQQFGPEHANNVQSAIGYGLPMIMAMTQTAQGRQGLDIFAGGAAVGNANVAMAFQHRRLFDPVTGNQNMSFDSLMNSSNAAYSAIFGSPTDPKVGGLYGAGAAEMTPLLDYLTKKGMVNTTLEASLFGDKNFVQSVQKSTGAMRQRYRDMLSDYGMRDDDVDEYMNGGSAYDSPDLQNLIQRSFGGRTGEQIKGLKSLTNAIRELAGPDVVTNVNQALAALDALAGQHTSQFSNRELAGILRNTTNSLKTMGLGWEEASSYMAFSNQRAQQMGYAGAMGVSNMSYMANQRAAIGLSGGISGQGYGLWNADQLTSTLGEQRLNYGKSEHAKLQASMLYYSQTGAEFSDSAEGKKLKDIMKRIEETGSGGEEWDRMSMEDKLEMLRSGMKDPNAISSVLDMAGNEMLMENVLGNNTGILDNNRRVERYELDDESRIWAAAAADKVGFGADLTDRMSSEFFKLSGDEAKNSTKAAESLARRMLEGMSDEEKQKYGATDDERMKKLMQLSGRFVAEAMGSAKTGANIGNFLNQYGDRALDAADAAGNYRKIQSLLDDTTQGMMTEGLGGFATNIVAAAKSQMEKDGALDIRKLLNAGFSTFGVGDEKNQKALAEALGTLADEQASLESRRNELVEAGEGDSVEAKNIKHQLDMLNNYILKLDEELEGKLDGAGGSDPSGTAGADKGAVFNNLVMVMPNNMEVRIGDVVAKPQGAGAVT